ncbi:nucleotidyl transferase AbiEii/AbiGii toxin family protein [Belliella alkalica]|uniref:nucleotidyl transferase AbiEii/AbiGii toxin family protein n=1 Tax=Belliella alkalica TaxID=1730871 RepID=UPI00210434C5|nr:nucleotidyl transferase AbiEii/AbiGii toxin family protein [Belliella alkalica]
MISKDSLHVDWITKVSSANRKADKILVEKVIRALLLLEGLVKQNLDFVFKGGTALMLILDSSKRLSIDIDIIIEKEPENLEGIFKALLEEQGLNFRNVRLQLVFIRHTTNFFTNQAIKLRLLRKVYS